MAAIILELRAAQGGADAQRFAAELLATYISLAARRGWQLIPQASHPSPSGLRYASILLRGKDLAGLAAEAGTHRVVRTPAGEDRRHTSAVTVALLPAPAPETGSLERRQLRIETFRASGAGGQNVQKVETAVRVTHLPSGLSVVVQDERHQERNRALALVRLEERVSRRAAGQRRQRDDALRARMHGSGDSAERIRSYLYGRGMVVDHRSGKRASLARVLGGEPDLLW